MARFDIASIEAAGLGEAPVASDIFFDLGMRYSIGNTVPTDFVSAHKWFNLAAMRGNRDAIRLRREVAEQMTDNEIAAAQRAARDWLLAN
jgi:TPR repeat protein